MQRRRFVRQSLGTLAFYSLPFGGKNTKLPFGGFDEKNKTLFLQPVPFSDINISGILRQRVMKNFDRLEEEKYRPDKVYITGTGDLGWPGDTEGRTILGLTMDAQATHRQPKYLDEIMSLYPQKANAKGYMGEVEPVHTFSEQQLASHGWVLRGFCEYYQWKKDPAVLAHIQNIVNNLSLPTKGYNKVYPIDPAKRKHEGSFAGNEKEEAIDHWKLSSDTGAVYIFLDGLTQAYLLLPSKELKAVINEMIDRLLQIDVVAIKAQTHATLTSLRALLRWYEHTHDEKLLSAVKKRYHKYREEGMTENYENYNWFGRPEWTEPCAVIDSFIVATQLWRFTGDASYLEDAHHIYFNGLELEQRSNGGFGLQNCSGAKEADARVVVDEAHWCCTMRGGEGLSRAVQYCFFSDDKTIVLPFYHNCEATLSLGNKRLSVKEMTAYPDEGKVQLIVMESNLSFAPTIKLFAPAWTSGHQLTINGKNIACKKEGGFLVITQRLKKGDVVILQFEQSLAVARTINRHTMPGYHSFRYGPLILSYKGNAVIPIDSNAKLVRTGVNDFDVQGEGITLHPLRHLMSADVSKEAGFSRQILFRDLL